eukprot:m51a1_g6640 putative geranylgeranyl transferase type-1 subunit beta-like (371) ;mRNA; r:108712-110028
MSEQQQQQQQPEQPQQPADIDRAALLRFLKRCVQGLPAPYASQDNNHLSLLYFVVSTLDLLGERLPEPDAKSLIEYVYSLQMVPNEDGSNEALCGFLGTPAGADCTGLSLFEGSSTAMTYVALCILRILGDDFGRVNRSAIVAALRRLQRPDGRHALTSLSTSPSKRVPSQPLFSFAAVGLPGRGEADMRFVYCACAISAMLGDWSAVDRSRTLEFILASQSYEGAFGQCPLQESHGGSTYCAVAALSLLGELPRVTRRADLVRWLCSRQVGGFQGRVNKPADSCYSFWIGSSLAMLGHADLINREALRAFIVSCQTKLGGFAKLPEDCPPDVLHTYYSICGLSLIGEQGIAPYNCAISISRRAMAEWVL